MNASTFTQELEAIYAALESGTAGGLNQAAARIDQLGRRLHGLEWLRADEMGRHLGGAVRDLKLAEGLTGSGREEAIGTAISSLGAALRNANEGLCDAEIPDGV